nr:protein sex-lethal-like [Leptinotarsa decemlineata]
MFGSKLGNSPFSVKPSLREDSSMNNSSEVRAITKNGAGDNNQDHDKTKLIVNYIPQFATENDLVQIFGPLGQLEYIRIMKDFKTGYSFGYGFVKYSRPSAAAKAIAVLNGFHFGNKRLRVSYSRPDMKDSNLYITYLPADMTERDLDFLFGEYGEIVQRRILKDKITGMPRGVAFVRYSKGKEAQAAIANLDGKVLENAMSPLRVRLSEDHGRLKDKYLEACNPTTYNRGIPQFRRGLPHRDIDVPRSFQNRYGRFPMNEMRNRGAGDAFLPRSLFY